MSTAASSSSSDRYQRHITPDLEPAYVDDEIAVLGTNTARSLTWKGGRVNFHADRQNQGAACASSSTQVIKIVVTHHPFDLPQGFTESHLVGGARMAMGHLAECGADLLLAGHMHVSAVCRTVLRYQIAGHSALVVQAGTAASTRGRGETQLVQLPSHRIGRRYTIERWSWSPEASAFAPAGRETYRKAAGRLGAFRSCAIIGGK